MLTGKEYFVILPKFSNKGKKGERQRISYRSLERYTKKVANHFGGVTVLPTALGCYQSPENELMCEEVIKLVTSSTSDESETEDRKFIQGLAKEAANEYGQYAIMTSEDDGHNVSFVEGDYSDTVKGKVDLGKELFARLLD
jgi:hypothetical protein